MERYKLVRVVGDEFHSANTSMEYGGLKYKVGEVTEVGGKGVACYKALKYADVYEHLEEAMKYYNRGKPVAIIQVEPIGRSIPNADERYQKGRCYQGGINYRAVLVTGVVRIVERLGLLITGRTGDMISGD